MKHRDNVLVPAITMEDDLGIVYLIENAQQFWSGELSQPNPLAESTNFLVASGWTELEDILNLPDDDAPTLSLLDSTLKRFLSLCATYHGE
jgi:hypothetical protein